MKDKKMILTFAAACALGVITTGCSTLESSPMTTSGESALVVEKDAYALTRQQIIQAIEECRSAKLRSHIHYGKRFVNRRPVDIVVDVSCY